MFQDYLDKSWKHLVTFSIHAGLVIWMFQDHLDKSWKQFVIFSTYVGLVIWMFQDHLDKSWTLASRGRRSARTSLHQANSVEAGLLGPGFVFGFFENGEEGLAGLGGSKKSGRRRGGRGSARPQR